MRTSTLTLVPVLMLILGLGGCSDSTAPSGDTPPSEAIATALGDGTPCGEPLTVDLIAAKSIDVGDVIVSNDSDELVIRIETVGEWVLTATQVAVGESLDQIPQSRSGNPKSGRFPLKARHSPPVSGFDYVIDCPYEPGQMLFLAVHTEVELQDGEGNAIDEAGAWADGLDFPGKNWAMYFNYTVQSCDSPADIVVSLSESDVCEYEPILISWEPASWESVMRIELLKEDGDFCSTIAGYAEDTGSYEWYTVGFCDDESMPGTYRIAVIDLDTGARGESELLIIEDCGGWGE